MVDLPSIVLIPIDLVLYRYRITFNFNSNQKAQTYIFKNIQVYTYRRTLKCHLITSEIKANLSLELSLFYCIQVFDKMPMCTYGLFSYIVVK